MAIEAIKEVKTNSELAQIHPNLVGLWKKEFLLNVSKVFDSGKEESEHIRKLENEKEELIKQIGQLTVDNNWLKKRFYDSIGNSQGINRNQ